jgi:adenine-specific DNA-methyltransferase
MAAKRRTKKQTEAEAYRHEEAKRKNNPEAGLIDFEPKRKAETKEYCWDPRESPQLVWAGKAGLRKVEVEEQASLEIPVVNLHIHERVSTEAILRAAKRQDAQRSLFADPEMEFTDEIRFYQHDVDWSNRMLLGDSLLVMNSLLEREQMRGKVQMIYMDPPYGISYKSNFQPRIDQRDVKDSDQDLSREVMQIQAFRDTWELGVHSYLTYLRDRLLLCRELLAETGSIFVQIGEENIHRARCLMDELYGEENFCALIPFLKTSGAGSPAVATRLIPKTADYLLWYAKNPQRVKYRSLYGEKEDPTQQYTWVEENWFSRRRVDDAEELRVLRSSPLARAFRPDQLTSQSAGETTLFPVSVGGKDYVPGKGGWKTNAAGMARLVAAGRLIGLGNTLQYVRYFDDFAATPIIDVWDDTRTSGFAAPKEFAVQTNQKVISRCMTMTTDPGDLVLDPTCGSGTTAYVAEQWGRRWITIDTSRVALAIARHRLMAQACFPWYKLRHAESGVAGGFVYETVPHIQLQTIARNEEIDEIAAKYQPQIDKALAEVNKAFGEEWREWEVPRPGGESPSPQPSPSKGEGASAAAKPPPPKGERDAALAGFWRLKREMQAEIDASIQRNAPQEELVDRPEVEKGIVRVSGPFSVESIPHPSEADVSAEVEVIPGDEERGEITVMTPAEERVRAENASAYVGDMIEKLRKTGVHVKGGRKIEFDTLRPLDHEIVHAEGEFTLANGPDAPSPQPSPRLHRGEGEHPDVEALKGKRVKCAVVFGPQNGAVSESLVRDVVRAAAPYDAMLFCGYDFTGPAQEVINGDPIPGKRLLMAYVHADTAMGDLLKDTKASQIFTMVGEPDVVVYRQDDPSLAALVEEANRRGVAEVAERAARLTEGEMFVELRGVDLYDALTGEVTSDRGENVHAVFIDHDYDGKSFCICQALFPNRKDSWEKIARNLRGTIDEEGFEAMRTLVSLPFKPGAKVQVKVIDARGNAVVKTVQT